jgi:hypothetical protein
MVKARGSESASAAERLDEDFAGDDGELDEEDLRAVDAAIDESDAELERGEGIPLDVVLAEMRRNLHAGG